MDNASENSTVNLDQTARCARVPNWPAVTFFDSLITGIDGDDQTVAFVAQVMERGVHRLKSEAAVILERHTLFVVHFATSGNSRTRRSAGHSSGLPPFLSLRRVVQ